MIYIKAPVILIFVTIISGCASLMTDNWVSNPEKMEGEIAGVDVEIIPVCGGYGCSAFFLNLKNNNNDDVKLDWNNTYYTRGGQTSGTFMFEGVVYSKRNETKSPDVIFSGESLQKAIRPNNLVSYESGEYGGWTHDPMPEGKNGVYLTLIVDGEEHSKRFTADFEIEEESEG